MPAPASPFAPRPAGVLPARSARHGGRPLWDSPRRILAGIAVLIAALAAILTIASRSSASPDFLSEFVLYALSAADLTMLAALVFVLARHIVKLVVERRRGRPFASLRGKLVALLLGMTLVPAVLVLAVGSEIIRTNMDRWFDAPMEEILSSANQLANDYRRERQALVSQHAERVARGLATIDFGAPDQRALRDRLLSDLALSHDVTLQVYRVGPGPDGAAPEPAPVFDVAGDALPPGYTRDEADRLALRALRENAPPVAEQALADGTTLLHASALIHGSDGQPVGAVVATDALTGAIVSRTRRMTQAYDQFSELRVLKRPLTGVYLSFFLMVTLMILVGALWMGLYLAKRITRPVLLLAAAAREIGAGRLDQRIEPESDDEFGALAEEFNAMAGELARSRRDVHQSTEELERRHVEVERRRRYVETILERIATGVVAFDAGGALTTLNGAAVRLLSLNRDVVGLPVRAVFGRPDLQPLARLVAGSGRVKTEPAAGEVTVLRDGLEVHLAAALTPLVGEDAPEGAVLVLDDVTPLIRTQKVAAWREVARRLAHEIKNPLTPIQLSAERLRRNFAGGPPGAQALVDECTNTIVGEVESLKGLVDEFSQFARMPAPRTVLTDLHRLILDTLALYDGLFTGVRIAHAFAPDLPLVRIDPEQVRRVIINLVDNAVEAMERSGDIVVETAREASGNLVRVVVADNGPGIPAAEREKLFLPYYSTKRRGSGLGLAIVRRIIAEHGGTIDVSDNHPRGTRFTIELPC